jgi:hypothetical protein
MIEPVRALIGELRGCGEKLTTSLRERIVAEGAPIVPALIEVLIDDEDVNGDDDTSGWASIHAVDLLVDLKVEAAIEPMLRVLAETDWDVIIHDRIVLRLPKLGAPVLEPALSMLAEDPPKDLAESLCAIVSQLGVRDERVFEHLVSDFHENPEMASGRLADYGDDRALPLIEQEIVEYVPDGGSPFGLMVLRELVEAYERLAGALPDDLRAHVDDLTGIWNADRAPAPRPRATSSTKIGRNDPCPCGSGKKYKRCHLGTDGGVL